MALIYPELSKRILGIAMQQHREMGCGFKEKVYQDAFEVLLKENNITYEKEKAYRPCIPWSQTGT